MDCRGPYDKISELRAQIERVTVERDLLRTRQRVVSKELRRRTLELKRVTAENAKLRRERLKTAKSDGAGNDFDAEDYAVEIVSSDDPEFDEMRTVNLGCCYLRAEWERENASTVVYRLEAELEKANARVDHLRKEAERSEREAVKMCDRAETSELQLSARAEAAEAEVAKLRANIEAAREILREQSEKYIPRINEELSHRLFRALAGEKGEA